MASTRRLLITCWFALAVLLPPVSSQDCLPAPQQCMKMDDCCSTNCYGSDQDKNITGECQPGQDCTDGGGKCTIRDDCCSYNCYQGVCQVAGGDRCTGEIGQCTDSVQCCSLWCDDAANICNHAHNSHMPSIILTGTTLLVTSYFLRTW